MAVTIGERAELLWRGVFGGVGGVGECGKRGCDRFQGGEFVIGQAQFVAQRFAFGDRADGKCGEAENGVGCGVEGDEVPERVDVGGLINNMGQNACFCHQG